MAVMLVISSCIVLAMTAVSEVWLFVLLYTILFACTITAYTATNGETSRKSPSAYRGTALGVLGFYVSSGRTLSTVVLGPVWDAFNLETVFLATGIGVILVTVAVYAYFLKKS